MSRASICGGREDSTQIVLSFMFRIACKCYTTRSQLAPGFAMSLWLQWYQAIRLLRPAFSRNLTFLWFATITAAFTVRGELLGVTSLVRALKLNPKCYERLLSNFHSKGINLDSLYSLWPQVVLRLFPCPVRINNRLVLVGDGIKVAKRGNKM